MANTLPKPLGAHLAPKPYLDELLRELYSALRNALEGRDRQRAGKLAGIYRCVLEVAGQGGYDQYASIRAVLQKRKIPEDPQTPPVGLEETLAELQDQVAEKWKKDPVKFKKAALRKSLEAADFPRIPTLASIVSTASRGAAVYTRFTPD